MIPSEIDQIYDWAIESAQNGQWDNDLKRKRFTRMIELAASTPAGAMAQVGVWHGHSLLMLAESSLRWSGTREIVGIDSFVGFAPDSKESGSENREHFQADIKRVRELFGPYPNVQIVDGWIPTAFRKLEPKATYSFVAIDVDLGKQTLDSLRYFWPRVVDGGIVYVDDYGYQDYPLCKKAVDLFCRSKDISNKVFEADSGIFWIRK